MPDRVWRWLGWISVGVFAAYRLPELTRYSLWYDELFSITLAQMDWSEMFAAAARDRTNPPLFYILLKQWMAIGDGSVAWVRLLPCLIGIAVAIPFHALCRRFLSPAAAGAALAAAAASPLLVFLSNEVRGYSLLTFMSALSLVATARVNDTIGMEGRIEAEGDSPNGLGYVAHDRRRLIVVLGLVNAILVYTHYFGWLLIAAELAVAFIWYRPALRWQLAANAVALVAFLPWAITVYLAARGVAAPLTNVDWISSPTLGDVPRFYDALVARVLTPDVAWLGAVVFLALGGALVEAWRDAGPGSAERARLGEIALLALLPVALAFVASVTMGRSVFVPRYLVVAAPAWLLLVGVGVSALGSLTARAGGNLERLFRVNATALTFVVFTLAAGALREIRGGEKIQWNEVVDAIAADAGQSGGTIYSLEGFTALPAAFYAGTEHPNLTVKPVSEIGALTPPAWLVVRTAPADSSAGLGAGLTPRGASLQAIHTARVPSHAITAYRVAPTR